MAGEPESLHIHEPLKARIERHDYDRLLMLSDGVFAIAITLLALELKLPLHWDGSAQELFGATGRPLIGYLFGFGLVGVFWFIHRRTFAQLEQVDRIITLLNLFLLGLVGLTPYVARMIAEAGPRLAMPFYLFAVASVLGAGGLIRGWAILNPRLLHAEVNHRAWRLDVTYTLLSVLVLGALGAYAIVQRRPVQGNLLVLILLVLAAARRFSRRSLGR